MSTTDNFTSTCLEHPLTKITQAQTGKAPWKPAKKKKKQKRKKEGNRKETRNRGNNGDNRGHKNKTNVYVLDERMVKKLNGHLFTKKISHKLIVKVRSFSGSKINCIMNHVKPTLREINPDHIVLHSDRNDLRTQNTTDEIAKATIDLAMMMKVVILAST